MMRPLFLYALLLILAVPAPSAAQDVGAEVVFHSLSVGDLDLTEIAFPVGVTYRAGPVRIDANTAVARATLQDSRSESDLSGLTDVLVRVMVPLLDDRARLIAAANIPTGSETLVEAEIPVAAALTTDLFTLPVTSFGSGAGFTAGFSYAHPVGPWIVGAVATYRVGAAYDPLVSTAGGTTSDFQPGDEMRIRLALERPSTAGTTVRFAGSWSRFDEDQADGVDFFDRGDRLLGEAMVEFPFRRGSGLAYAWGLHRSEGTANPQLAAAEIVTGSRTLIGGGARFFMPVGATTSLRPVAEVINQTTADVADTSLGDGVLFRAGSGLAFRVGRATLEPAVLAQIGSLDGETITGFILRGGLVLSR